MITPKTLHPSLNFFRENILKPKKEDFSKMKTHLERIQKEYHSYSAQDKKKVDIAKKRFNKLALEIEQMEEIIESLEWMSTDTAHAQKEVAKLSLVSKYLSDLDKSGIRELIELKPNNPTLMKVHSELILSVLDAEIDLNGAVIINGNAKESLEKILRFADKYDNRQVLSAVHHVRQNILTNG